MKKLVSFIAVIALASGAFALDLTDVNSSQYWGKTAMPKLTAAIDANNALIEAKSAVYTASATGAVSVAVSDGRVIVADSTAGAIELTLPDASLVLGEKYTIILVTDGGTDLTVAGAGTDTFNATGNTLLTFAEAEDAVVITAISANRWLIETNIGSVAGSTP